MRNTHAFAPARRYSHTRTALAVLALVLAAGTAVARDRGHNQPGAAGNTGAKGDPGKNQPGAAGNVKATPGAGAPGAGVTPGVGAGAPGRGVTPGVGAGAPGPGVTPGVGAPGPGAEPANRGGPVNRPGRR